MRKMLEKSEEFALARAWRETGCERSRARLVEAYQPMIRRIARGHLRSGLGLEDLVQEGVIGFMAALENFDPERGYAIGTLARYHIAARIQLHVSEFAGVIRLPNSRRIKGLVSKCIGRIRAAEAEQGESLGDTRKREICEEAGFTLEELHEYERVMRPAKSVHASAADDDERGFDLPDEAGDPHDALVASRTREQSARMLADLLGALPERTRRIIALRHLSDDFVSLDAIAAELGISRERVRRIELDALATLRQRLSDNGIDGIADLA